MPICLLQLRLFLYVSVLNCYYSLMALTIISINGYGVRGPSKRAGFLHWLHSLPCIPDIVCLQEAHCMSSEECSSWFSSSGLSFVVSPGSINSFECIVLYRPVLSLVSSSSDPNGRFLLCNFSFRDVVFSCPPSELFFFLLLAAVFLHLVFLCWCCAFMACPALLTANQRLCWISRLTGDLFLVCHLLLRWIVFPVFLLL